MRCVLHHIGLSIVRRKVNLRNQYFKRNQRLPAVLVSTICACEYLGAENQHVAINSRLYPTYPSSGHTRSAVRSGIQELDRIRDAPRSIIGFQTALLAATTIRDVICLPDVPGS